jgi:hypothetical protein
VPASPKSPTTALHVLASFDAGESSSVRPPDAGVAAGDGELLEATNAGLHLLDSHGRSLAPPAATTAFFGPVSPRGIRASDPRVAWDPAGRRFVLVMFGFLRRPPCRAQSECGDRLLVAVSRTANPHSLEPSEWLLDAETMGPDGTTFIQTIDFPSLAVTPAAIVITANAEALLPGNTSGITHERVRIIDRAALERDPASAPRRDIDDLRDAEKGGGVSNVMPAMGSTRLLLVMTAEDCRVRLWQVDDPLVTATVTPAIAGKAATCADPLNASQPGKVSSLESDGARLHSRPWVRDGRLWVAHTVAGAEKVAAIVWTEIDISAYPTVAVLQEGRVATPGVSSFYPAVQPGPNESLVMIYATSGERRRVTVMVAGRSRGDPRGSLRAPVALHTSESVQETAVSDPTQRNRFGDYYDTSIDPDGRSAWATGEYIRAPEQWSMWMARVAFPS